MAIEDDLHAAIVDDHRSVSYIWCAGSFGLGLPEARTALEKFVAGKKSEISNLTAVYVKCANVSSIELVAKPAAEEVDDSFRLYGVTVTPAEFVDGSAFAELEREQWQHTLGTLKAGAVQPQLPPSTLSAPDIELKDSWGTVIRNVPQPAKPQPSISHNKSAQKPATTTTPTPSAAKTSTAPSSKSSGSGKLGKLFASQSKKSNAESGSAKKTTGDADANKAASSTQQRKKRKSGSEVWDESIFDDEGEAAKEAEKPSKEINDLFEDDELLEDAPVIENPTKKVEEPAATESPPEPKRKKVVRRVKKKKLKTVTEVNERGYTVSKDVMVTDSEEEEVEEEEAEGIATADGKENVARTASKPVKSAGNSAAGAPGNPKAKGKTQQKSIMSFFGKK